MKELDIIEHIKKRAGKASKGLKLGIGDDCAVIDQPGGDVLLWAADMLIEGTHFSRSEGYKRIGAKAVAVNISDIAAMGGDPEFITVSIGVPSGMSKGSIASLYDGIFSICKEYGVSIAGGDTNRADRIVIDVSILGKAKKKNVITRGGAKDGDLVVITGPVRNGRKEHLDFRPRLSESRMLSGKYKVGAMIDTSDGIALDVSRICLESKLGCRLYEDAIPLSKGLSLDDALYYGESFELLFTMPEKETVKLFKELHRKKQGCPFFVIGEITKKRNGRKLVRKEGKVEPLKIKGFTHI